MRFQVAKASGLMQLSSSAQYLISPFLAGILLTIIDIKFIFTIDISTFLIASVIIIWIRKTLLPISKKVFMNFLKTKVSFG
jgi:hypothetical protein